MRCSLRGWKAYAEFSGDGWNKDGEVEVEEDEDDGGEHGNGETGRRNEDRPACDRHSKKHRQCV